MYFIITSQHQFTDKYSIKCLMINKQQITTKMLAQLPKTHIAIDIKHKIYCNTNLQRRKKQR